MFSTDVDLDYLGKCATLETLMLHNLFSMKGTSLAGLRNSPNFTKLDISGKSQITNANLAVLKHLQKLSELSLSLGFGITSAILPLLSDCPRLSKLTLRDLSYYYDSSGRRDLLPNELAPLIDDDLAVLEHYPYLNNLTLVSPLKITSVGLQHLSKCKQLSSVTLNQIHTLRIQDLVFLQDCPQLSTLTICSTSIQYGGCNWSFLNNFKKLSSLIFCNLVMNGATLRSLEVCPRIKHLKLEFMSTITNANLVALETCTQIETLELAYNEKITQAGVDALQAKCPNLKISYKPYY
jgi:hypothetical protein